VRARSAITTDLDGLYAAQRLTMVRLALLLVGDSDVAETVVQGAFGTLARRHDRRADSGMAVADLRRHVVDGCRAVLRRRSNDVLPPIAARDTADEVLGLPLHEREVVVLEVWGRLSRPQVAAALRLTERAVATAQTAALETLRRSEEPVDGTATLSRVAEALERRADAVGADDLHRRFVEVVEAQQRRTARHRHWWLVAVAVVIVLAVVLAVVVGLDRYSAPPPAPPPSPVPPPTLATTALSSPALAPGERPRSAVQWDLVGAGWSFVVTATSATAVTTTLLLVSPHGTRYALSSATEGMVLQDVSADGRYLMVGVGARAEEWDLQAGTAREVVTPFGWKTLRYAGPDPSYGYFVLWTDSASAVRLGRWTADGNLRTDYDTPLASTAGSPRHPGVLVSPSGATALLSSRNGPLQLLDLASDDITSPGPFVEAPTCEPLALWSHTEALVGCGSSVQVNAVDNLVGRPLLVTPAGQAPVRAAVAWPNGGLPLLQLEDLCSTSLATLQTDGRVTPITVPEVAAGLVPNSVVGDTVFLGGTRCAVDGNRLVAFDLANGGTSELVGSDVDRRTVRQALVMATPS
jgi:DNA-directed RNA polymerase specialized sigma24 family protein